MEATSNSPRLAVIIFIGSMGSDEYQKLGGQEVFVGGGRLQTIVSYMEVWWLGGEVDVVRGNSCRSIGLINGRRDTRSYETVILTNPRGCRTLSVEVAVAEAKNESWAQNCEGGKVKRDYK